MKKGAAVLFVAVLALASAPAASLPDEKPANAAPTLAARAEFLTLHEEARQAAARSDFADAELSLTMALAQDVPREDKREVLLEMGRMLEEKSNQRTKAATVYEQFLSLFPQDPEAPDLNLRLGRIYRDLGSRTAAMNKFYDVLYASIRVTEAVRQFADAKGRLGDQGTLTDAVKFFLEHRAKAQATPIAVPDLVENMLEDLREKGKSRRYLLDMQARLNRAAKFFTSNIGEITSLQIDDWLSSLTDTTGRTKNNYRASLITLFAYARQKGYLARGQETEAEFAARYNGKGGEIGIYAPAQLNVLLSEINPRFVPFVAIGAFAGLRTAEIVRLEWPEIRFGQDVIEIKASKAKTASRRLVPILPILREWLEPLRREKGKVLSGVLDEFAQATQFRKAVAEIRDGNGKSRITIVHNGLRHSFITYRMAILKNAAEVALEAGNSPRMIFEHYRELATAGDAAAWFAICPSKGRNAELEHWAKAVAKTVGEPESKLVVPPRKPARPKRNSSRRAVAA